MIEEATMSIRTTTLLAGAVLLLAVPAVQASVYKIDTAHSEVGFAVRHMMISTVRGSFGEFAGTFTYAKAKPAAWSAEVTIQTASIDTREQKRDQHLRSADFFDVENHPTMTFKSTKVEAGEKSFKLHGELTLLGVTKPVVLDVEPTGEITDPRGNRRAGFSARGKISRKDWGMTWSQALDAGGVVVGDEVRIELEVQGIAES
jgi:polyisoprenoid-binding protein YceI